MKTILQAIINYRIRADMALSEVKDGVYTQKEYEEALKKIGDQALKELGELLLECKPEKKTKKDVPDPYEVGIHATIPVAQASGYNQAIDDYEKNIKEVLK